MKTRFRHKRLPRGSFDSAALLAWMLGDGNWKQDATPEALRLYAHPYCPGVPNEHFPAHKDGAPHERGGITTCELVVDDEVVAQGVAYCSLKDNFCYRTGRAIARGRAEKQLREVTIGVQ